jgi:hypothetical protein
MGSSEYTHMYYDLEDLLAPDPNLATLEHSFSKEEIDSVIKQLPNNKAPGPDGFNGDFFKNAGLS